MAQLTKEQIEAIENYGDKIKSLKDFVTACRRRPGMYIGEIGNNGVLNMVREIFQNCIDQVIDKSSPADRIKISYDERDGHTTVEDNGLGFPFDDIIRMLSKEHTSKNYEKRLFDYSSGMHGLGLKVVNALSSTLVIESYRYDGKAVRVESVEGYPKSNKPTPIPNPGKRQGSYVSFIPDQSIMGDITLEWKSVYRLVKHIVSITPIGTVVEFSAIDHKGKPFTETIVNKDGIVTDIIMKVKNPANKPIVLGADDGIHKLDIAFCYDYGDESGPNDDPMITSFSNFCPTRLGKHIDGSIDGICRWFVAYMNNIYLTNQKSKDKLKVMAVDVKTGLNVFISAAHLEPIFTGQAKEILSNEDMAPFCKDVVMKGLDDWAKANPGDLAKLAKFFKDIAELRVKQEAGKTKIVAKYAKNTITNLPSKYKDPIDKTGIELIIVEGDSALGMAEIDRDPHKQGLFPIRGKIINPFRNSKQKVLENEEFQGITQIIFGQEYRKGLTIDDCKVDKIIFMADADVDGAHISALLLRLMLMYYPFLIAAGKVYKAVPPLYSIKEGKRRVYFTENIDFIKYVQKTFVNNNTIVDLKKSQISPKELSKFFLTNMDYIYHLEKVANTYAVNPYLLEMVLFNFITNGNSVDFKKLKKEVTGAYRFMDVEMNGNIVVVKGTIEKSNLIIINDKFLFDCRYIFDILNNNSNMYYILNGKKSSLYEIMKVYEATTPAGRQRYKGLGEMNGGELGESTLRPDSDRVLIRYTIDDIKDSINFVREYESDMKKILQFTGDITREDLLD